MSTFSMFPNLKSVLLFWYSGNAISFWKCENSSIKFMIIISSVHVQGYLKDIRWSMSLRHVIYSSPFIFYLISIFLLQIPTFNILLLSNVCFLVHQQKRIFIPEIDSKRTILFLLLNFHSKAIHLCWWKWLVKYLIFIELISTAYIWVVASLTEEFWVTEGNYFKKWSHRFINGLQIEDRADQFQKSGQGIRDITQGCAAHLLYKSTQPEGVRGNWNSGHLPLTKL